MTRANTDTEPKYQNANTGTGTIVECQYRSWTVPLPILNQSTEMTVLVQAPFLDASSGNGLCLYWYWTKVQKCQDQYRHHFRMPVPVIECAYTGTEPKCKNANSGTGNIKHQYR